MHILNQLFEKSRMAYDMTIFEEKTFLANLQVKVSNHLLTFMIDSKSSR